MNKKLIAILIGLSLCASITGCSKKSAVTTSNSTIISSITMSSGEKETIGEANTFIELGDNITVTSKGDSLRGKDSVVITDGTITINSGEDGNSAQSASSKTDGGAPGSYSGNGVININGGYLNINTAGDSIDANGSIYMKNGTVIVNGPTNAGNGALDYDGKFELTGGVLVSAGSLGMAQAPSSSSTQNSIKVNLSSQSANTLVHIENEAGENILTFAPSKQYASVVVSSPKLKTGSTYKVYVGGSSTGTSTNGVYVDGTYTKGTEIGKVTISSTVSEVTQEGVTINNMGRGQGRPGGHGGQGGQGAPDGIKNPQK